MDPLPETDAPEFRLIADLVRERARQAPDHPALVADTTVLSYGELDALMDRVCASLQRDGAGPGDTVALCGASTPLQAAVFLGALRAGVAVAPLAASVTPESFASMLADAGARWLFADAGAPTPSADAGALRVSADAGALRVSADAGALRVSADAGALRVSADAGAPARIALDAAGPGRPLADWLVAPGTTGAVVAVGPQSPFNIIYSSGTTGQPKGIVQSHGMRWGHVARGATYGYGPDGVTLLATPLYSNTTLVVFFPTIAFGGTVVLMAKFDAARYLALAQRHRVTHTMLVPVQYQRLMALPAFDDHDLSAMRFKFCTSAPFDAALKADVLRRWPGGLIEFYGMTEGGGTCILAAHAHPDKLHTVGQPAPGHDIRLIDDDGREVPPGGTGEVVGHSGAMMLGYHRQPQKTREALWFDGAGKRFIRTGDVGRFDAEGFLTLLDRKKDLVISGGFNIYPSDLEAELRTHPQVADVAVIGVPSSVWGETPMAFVVPRDPAGAEARELLAWVNERLGKTQRLSALEYVAELPRSAIGKVLKRELRERVVARPPDGAAGPLR